MRYFLEIDLIFEFPVFNYPIEHILLEKLFLGFKNHRKVYKSKNELYDLYRLNQLTHFVCTLA